MTGLPLTAVMYHYVRPVSRSRYPRINGLEVAAFKEQLAYLDRHYTVVTMEGVIAAIRGQESLPPNAALLTFDDGYRDHYDFVLPLLIDKGLQGSFFVPADPVVSRRVLDVNKLHLILAVSPETGKIVDAIEGRIEGERDRLELPSRDELRKRFRTATRFDSPDVAYIKRLLQRVLPEDFRSKVTASLFSQYVSSDEAAMAKEIYLSPAQIAEMLSAGMHLGGHGNRHYWLGSLSAAEQRGEIAASVAFLRSMGVAEDSFTFCYPYGDYNSDTLEILADFGCAACFTTRIDVATLPGTPAFELPRLDTNDLPKDSTAPSG